MDKSLARIRKIIKTKSLLIKDSFFRNYFKFKGKISQEIIEKPFQIVYISTDLINESVVFSRTKSFKIVRIRMVGPIKNGDWDICRTKFEDHHDSIGLKERFVEGKKWEDTFYYKYRKNRISKNQLKKILIKNDKLFEEISGEGYQMQNEVKNNWKFKKPLEKKPENEIEVGISRDGEVLFIDGRHRLTIAKILGIKKIPVIVDVWHKEYIDWIKTNTNIKKVTPSHAIMFILNGTIKDKLKNKTK